MPIPEPTNCWTQAEARIAAAIAASPTFGGRPIFGEQLPPPDSHEAYTRAELDTIGAYAQVGSQQQNPYAMTRVGNLWEPNGVAWVYFYRRLPADIATQEYVPQELERDFKNWVGSIMDDSIDWLTDNGGPWVVEWAVTEYGLSARETWDTEGAWEGAGTLVAWGRQQ